MEEINSITAMSFFAVVAGEVSNDVVTGFALLKGYNNFNALFPTLVRNYERVEDDKERKSYRYHILNLLEELYSQLRRLSESIKNCDSPLTNIIGTVILNSIILMIHLYQKEEFPEQHGEIEKLLDRFIWLPGWFVHHAKKIDNMLLFDSLPNTVAQAGIALIELPWAFKQKHEVVEALYSMMKDMISKNANKYGYDEARSMTKLCFLGILALKDNELGLFKSIALKIFEFEELYYKEFIASIVPPKGFTRAQISGIPDKDQLKIELLKWRGDFIQKQRSGSFTADPVEARLLGQIDEIDIDTFIFEVWSEIPAGSKSKEVLKKKVSARKNLRKLYMIQKKAKRNKVNVIRPQERGSPQTEY